MGSRAIRAGKIQRDLLLLVAEITQGSTQKPRGGGSGADCHLQQAGHSAARAGGTRRRGGGCGVRLGIGHHHLSRQAGGSRRDLLFDFGSGAGVPGAGAQVPRLCGAAQGQLLRRAQQRSLQRWVVRLHSQRRALPDGAVDLLPHQRAEYRAVRTHPDHRRRRQPRQLPRGLHGAHAR